MSLWNVGSVVACTFTRTHARTHTLVHSRAHSLVLSIPGTLTEILSMGMDMGGAMGGGGDDDDDVDEKFDVTFYTTPDTCQSVFDVCSGRYSQNFGTSLLEQAGTSTPSGFCVYLAGAVAGNINSTFVGTVSISDADPYASNLMTTEVTFPLGMGATVNVTVHTSDALLDLFAGCVRFIVVTTCIA